MSEQEKPKQTLESLYFENYFKIKNEKVKKFINDTAYNKNLNEFLEKTAAKIIKEPTKKYLLNYFNLNQNEVEQIKKEIFELKYQYKLTSAIDESVSKILEKGYKKIDKLFEYIENTKLEIEFNKNKLYELNLLKLKDLEAMKEKYKNFDFSSSYLKNELYQKGFLGTKTTGVSRGEVGELNIPIKNNK